MSKTLFTAAQFIPTEWDSAEAKAKFANHFVKFVEGGMKESQFPKWFYNRLIHTFGHIAHYNQHGFIDTYFRSVEGKVNFLARTLNGGGFGSPAFTYSDVEKALKAWLETSGLVSRYVAERNAKVEADERATLAKLQAKYPTTTGVIIPGDIWAERNKNDQT